MRQFLSVILVLLLFAGAKAQELTFSPTNPELQGLFLTSMVQEAWVANEIDISNSELQKIKKVWMEFMNSGAPLAEDRKKAIQTDQEFFAKAKEFLTEEQQRRFIQIWRWGFVLNDNGLFPNLSNPLYHSDLGLSEHAKSNFLKQLEIHDTQFKSKVQKIRVSSYRRFAAQLSETQRAKVEAGVRGKYEPEPGNELNSIKIFSYILDETESSKKQEVSALKKEFLSKSHAIQKERGISNYMEREKLEAELLVEFGPRLREILGQEEFQTIRTNFVRFHFKMWADDILERKIYMFNPVLRAELEIDDAQQVEIEELITEEGKQFNVEMLEAMNEMTNEFQETLGPSGEKWSTLFGPPPRILVEGIFGYAQDEDYTR